MRRFPYFGSFQRGQIFDLGEPSAAAWREVERIGTTDNLARIACSKDLQHVDVRTAALRIRQAVEFRRLSRIASPLEKPLLQYYAALNLVRGLLLAHAGDFGGNSHGLKYEAGPTLLSSAAIVPMKGRGYQSKKPRQKESALSKLAKRFGRSWWYFTVLFSDSAYGLSLHPRGRP